MAASPPSTSRPLGKRNWCVIVAARSSGSMGGAVATPAPRATARNHGNRVPPLPGSLTPMSLFAGGRGDDDVVDVPRADGVDARRADVEAEAHAHAGVAVGGDVEGLRRPAAVEDAGAAGDPDVHPGGAVPDVDAVVHE